MPLPVASASAYSLSGAFSFNAGSSADAITSACSSEAWSVQWRVCKMINQEQVRDVALLRLVGGEAPRVGIQSNWPVVFWNFVAPSQSANTVYQLLLFTDVS
jgi:hypothetical protein